VAAGVRRRLPATGPFRASALRTRTAVLAAGLAVTIAAGAGAAAAASSGGEAAVGASASASAPAVVAAGKTVTGEKAAAAAAKTQAAGAGHAEAAKAKLKVMAEANAKKAASWARPVSHYKLTAGFGLGGSLWSHKHSGQDFAVPTGTPVHAAHRGTVVKAGPDGGGDGPAYGNAIVISNGAHMFSQYAHLSRIEVHVGQYVQVGQQIGLSGNTGNTTGPHLHFEIRTTADYGSAINPVPYLRHEGVTV
jgi:murein DD-endopeptidase MepM/ murein hydrolase activator NlpD